MSIAFYNTFTTDATSGTGADWTQVNSYLYEPASATNLNSLNAVITETERKSDILTLWKINLTTQEIEELDSYKESASVFTGMSGATLNIGYRRKLKSGAWSKRVERFPGTSWIDGSAMYCLIEAGRMDARKELKNEALKIISDAIEELQLTMSKLSRL